MKNPEPGWTFLTTHAAVLGWIADHPKGTVRELAYAVGITERTASKVIGDLDAAGHVTRRRQGRRNVYRVNRGAFVQQQGLANVSVDDLLSVIVPGSADAA